MHESVKFLSESLIFLFSVLSELGGSGRLSISRTAAYFSIKFASKSANPFHSSLFQCVILLNLLLHAASLCIHPNDFRRNTVKNSSCLFVIALQSCFLHLFERTLLLALFQCFRQVSIFLFNAFFSDSAVVKHFSYFFICVSIAATFGIYFSRKSAICATRSL